MAPTASPPYTNLWLDGFLRGFSRCSIFYSIFLQLTRDLIAIAKFLLLVRQRNPGDALLHFRQIFTVALGLLLE